MTGLLVSRKPGVVRPSVGWHRPKYGLVPPPEHRLISPDLQLRSTKCGLGRGMSTQFRLASAQIMFGFGEAWGIFSNMNTRHENKATHHRVMRPHAGHDRIFRNQTMCPKGAPEMLRALFVCRYVVRRRCGGYVGENEALRMCGGLFYLSLSFCFWRCRAVAAAMSVPDRSQSLLCGCNPAAMSLPDTLLRQMSNIDNRAKRNPTNQSALRKEPEAFLDVSSTSDATDHVFGPLVDLCPRPPCPRPPKPTTRRTGSIS